MNDQYMLTTVDNPYDPFTQFDEWNVWDQQSGYNTLSYLGRVVVTSHELSQADQDQANEQAIDEIVSNNAGLYKKVSASASLDPTT
jgi:hypothetical protein